MRLRLTRFGWLVSALMVATLVGGATVGVLTLGGVPWWPVTAAVGAVAVIAGRWVWMATRVIAATERAVVVGSAACGFQPVEPLDKRPGKTPVAVRRPLTRFEEDSPESAPPPGMPR